MKRWPWLVSVTAVFVTTVLAKPEIAKPTTISLPGGTGGIGFDDLTWSPALHRVIAPAGRTGMLDLIDPATRKIESIAGFSTEKDTFAGGHGEGTTSADVGGGLVFASDRGTVEVVVVDPKAKKLASRSKLAAKPDYVRWVEPLQEVWVTEPRPEQIEYFALDKGALVKKGALTIKGGPESLVVDATRKRAYTHTWKDETVVIDLAKHAEVARWKNGCKGARGIALDEKRGRLFVGCEEGKVTALDVATGKQLGEAKTGQGVDIIAFAPALGHVYAPGGDSKTLTILGVGDKISGGTLEVLGSVGVGEDAHCVTIDDAGKAYVCDPKTGSLLVVADPFPRS